MAARATRTKASTSRSRPSSSTKSASATSKGTSARSATRRTAKAQTIYEGGSQSRRTFGWHAPTISPNLAILGSLTTLRDRSRAATRNDGYAKGAIDELVSELVGTGIKPMSRAQDPAFRKVLQQRWLYWTDESDADGLLDWYGQQAQATRAWLEGGECFVRLRPRLPIDGLSVPLQVQVIEPELCPHHHNITLPNGNRVRAGIEFNGIGKRVAYWFHPSRPGELFDYDPSQLRRVPADSVIHLYDPLRPGQLRGVPHLTPALVFLHELAKLRDATLLREQLRNLFVAFLTHNANPDETAHALTGLTAETDSEGRSLLGLQPGLFQELGFGEDVKFSDPPETGTAYADFMRANLRAVAAAVRVPYEMLTGDMTGLNDRLVRVILHKFRRRLQAWQHQIIGFQLCRPVWSAWMNRGFLSGTLPLPAEYGTDPERWAAVKWSPQSWPYLHPVQDVEAQQAAVRTGLTSRAAQVSEQGEDAEEIDEQQAEDNARADKLGLKYDSDGRQPKNGNRDAGVVDDNPPAQSAAS